MKVYLVEIGNTTRRGGFIAQSRFAVQSESEQNGVYAHYQKRYTGFAVNVSEVTVLEENVIALPNTYNMGETEVDCGVNYPKNEDVLKLAGEFCHTEKIYYKQKEELTKLLNQEIKSINIEGYKTKYFNSYFTTKIKLEKLMNLRMEQAQNDSK